MAMIISVVSGGSVIGVRQIGAAAHGGSRMKAVAGARYVLAESLGGNAPAGVSVKRIGKDLVIGQTSDGAQDATFIIEDYLQRRRRADLPARKHWQPAQAAPCCRRSCCCSMQHPQPAPTHRQGRC